MNFNSRTAASRKSLGSFKTRDAAGDGAKTPSGKIPGPPPGDDALSDDEKTKRAAALDDARKREDAEKKAAEEASERTKADLAEAERRQAERDADDARKWREHQAERKVEEDMKRERPPAAIVARDNLMKTTGMSQRDAEAAVAVVYASRSEQTPSITNELADASIANPQAHRVAASNMPEYSPQNLGPGGRALARPGAPDIIADATNPAMTGSERLLESLRIGDEPMLTFRVPKRFKLVLHDFSHVYVPGGLVRIPAHLADHHWLKANGAKREA